MATKTEIILRGPEDWTKWDRAFKTKAIAMELWDFIKEDPEELLSKPTMPDPEDYRVSGMSTRSATVAGRSRSTIDLNTEETRNFQIAWNIYTQKSRQYEAQNDNIRDLKDWVTRTIAQQYIDSSCDPTESLHEWHTKLKEHASVGEVMDKKEVRQRYKAAVKPLAKPPRDWNSWIINWEEAMSLGNQIGVADTNDSSYWFDDFIDAVKQAIPHWATSYQLLKQAEADRGTLTYRTVANDFRKETRPRAKGGSGSIAKGSFGPAYAQDSNLLGQSEDSGDASNHGIKQTLSKEGKKRPRKSTSAGSVEKCLACELPGHRLADCFYVFSEKAFEGFKPRKHIQNRVDENMKKDEVVKAVNTLKNKKVRTDQDPDS
jgi:hypothetical protein